MQVQITTTAKRLGLSLSDVQCKQLADYLALLHKWNSAYNLSALKSLDEMLVKHLYDCLAVVQPIANILESYEHKTVLDVGTGAGLPGIVLAICLPHVQVTMLDAVQKKVTFVKQAIGVLKLENAAAHGIRIQDWQQTHSIITARAWTALADISTLTAHCLAANGRIAAMKGPRLAVEAEALPEGWIIEKVIDIVVPELKDARCLAVIKRKND